MAGLRTGIFGGTFDPPHIGHRALADQACLDLKLDRLLWVLTADPPHKRDRRITPLEHRLAMLQAALRNDPRYGISRVDIDRPPPHYAVDTVRILRDQFPQDVLIYVMGGDSLRDLSSWYDPQGFIQEVDGLAVLRRPGVELDLPAIESKLPGFIEKIYFLNAPEFAISSSEIRRLAKQGNKIYQYLSPDVFKVIEERQLYIPSTI